jgi:hypothetical protein
MRTRILSAAIVAVFIFVPDIIQACGDKFLLVGRGARFQNAYAAIHPASILILVPPKSVKDAAIRDSRLLNALKMAGHRIEVVQLPASLPDVLERGRFDMILAEQADAGQVPAAAASGRPQASVIPVLENPPADVLATAERQSEGVLRTPERLSRILSMLDDVMQKRIQTGRSIPTRR